MEELCVKFQSTLLQATCVHHHHHFLLVMEESCVQHHLSNYLPVHQLKLVIPVITTIVILPVTHSFILQFCNFLTITTLTMIIIQSSNNRSLSQFFPTTVETFHPNNRCPCISNHILYLMAMDVKATCLTSSFIKMDHNNLLITVQCTKIIVSPCILILLFSHHSRIWEYPL